MTCVVTKVRACFFHGPQPGITCAPAPGPPPLLSHYSLGESGKAVEHRIDLEPSLHTAVRVLSDSSVARWHCWKWPFLLQVSGLLRW